MRTLLMAFAISAVSICGLSGESVNSEEYIFEDYVFEWVLYSRGDTTLSMVKTPDRVIVRVKSGFFDQEMSPAVAQVVAKLTDDTEKFYQEMKGGKEVIAKENTVDENKAIFQWSPKDGFSVKIRAGGGFSSVQLDRNAARSFSRLFADAERKADFLMEKVDF